jgi:hypothetical protein
VIQPVRMLPIGVVPMYTKTHRAMIRPRQAADECNCRVVEARVTKENAAGSRRASQEINPDSTHGLGGSSYRTWKPPVRLVQPEGGLMLKRTLATPGMFWKCVQKV